MKIRYVIILIFIILGLVGSIGGPYYDYYASEDVLEQEVFNHFLGLSEAKAHNIEIYLTEQIEKLEIAATHSELSTEELLKIKEISNDFSEVFVLDSTGKIIRSTNPSTIGEDSSHNEYFLEGMKKSHLKTFHFSETTKENSIVISTPHANGVLAARLEFEELKSIVTNKEGLKETGEVLLAIKREDGSIAYLFERLFESEALSLEQSELTAEPMKQALLGNEMLFENSLDYRNKEVIAVSQYIEIGNLGLVVKIDKEEALREYRSQLFQNVLVVIIAIIIFVSVLGLIIAQNLSKPIRRLTENLTEISKGNLAIELGGSKVFEIQSLINSLNRILASMKLAILRTGASKGELGLGEAIKAKNVAEEKFKAIFNNVSVGIIGVNPKTKKFIFVNPEMSKITGYSEEELLTLGVANIHPKKDLPQVIKQFERQAKGEIELAKNIPILKKDGKVIYCDIKSAIQTIEGKKVLLGIFNKLNGDSKPLVKLNIPKKIVKKLPVKKVIKKKIIKNKLLPKKIIKKKVSKFPSKEELEEVLGKK